jgi:hypothetical protein
MKRFLIKIAYMILRYYSLDKMPYLYRAGHEYEVISLEIHPVHNNEKDWIFIKAEKKD